MNDETIEHEHQWGPLEYSRLAGTCHRKCRVAGCKAINPYDDDDEVSDEEAELYADFQV